jgi:hypothetical protein
MVNLNKTDIENLTCLMDAGGVDCVLESEMANVKKLICLGLVTHRFWKGYCVYYITASGQKVVRA